MMNKPETFKTKVERFEGIGTWTFALIPFSVEERFGSKGKMKVKGRINGKQIESTLMPQGNGQHFIILSKEIREKTNIAVGDHIEVELIEDKKSKDLSIPVDLLKSLKKHKAAFEHFNSLAPSHKKEYLKWIEEAKKEETRQNRIIKTIEKLTAKQKLK